MKSIDCDGTCDYPSGDFDTPCGDPCMYSNEQQDDGTVVVHPGPHRCREHGGGLQ